MIIILENDRIILEKVLIILEKDAIILEHVVIILEKDTIISGQAAIILEQAIIILGKDTIILAQAAVILYAEQTCTSTHAVFLPETLESLNCKSYAVRSITICIPQRHEDHKERALCPSCLCGILLYLIYYLPRRSSSLCGLRTGRRHPGKRHAVYSANSFSKSISSPSKICTGTFLLIYSSP
jgi:hypothetical protein